MTMLREHAAVKHRELFLTKRRMPPVKGSKKLLDLRVLGYHFLGPGIDLARIRNVPVVNKLDQAAKIHDLEYGKLRIKTVIANAKFLRNAGYRNHWSSSKNSHHLNTHLDWASTLEEININLVFILVEPCYVDHEC